MRLVFKEGSNLHDDVQHSMSLSWLRGESFSGIPCSRSYLIKSCNWSYHLIPGSFTLITKLLPDIFSSINIRQYSSLEKLGETSFLFQKHVQVW